MDTIVKETLWNLAIGATLVCLGVVLGMVIHRDYIDPVVHYCPVPPESEVVCGYVHDDNPNHAGLYLRGTGCAEYDGGEG